MCEAEYEFPSGIKIQCQNGEKCSGKHYAEWEGKEGNYSTWWKDGD